MAEPLILAPRDLDFHELDDLRLYLERVLKRAVISLGTYCDTVTGGFFHLRRMSTPGDYSKASSATCLAFLVHAGLWETAEGPWAGKSQVLAKAILSDDKWDSADLPPNNFFTTTFLLEALADLRSPSRGTVRRDNSRINKNLDLLKLELAKREGIGIEGYPPTTFVTQKAVRVLRRWDSLDDKTRADVAAWVWPRLYEESVAVAAQQPDADVFELGYAVLTASIVAPLADMTPRQRAAIEKALDQFFAAQRDDGSWPRSQPLFHYPRLGNAYCYDYEFLVQLLTDDQLQDILYGRLTNFRRAALALDASKILIGGDGELGWATGHLKQSIADPESWSTASVFHYCFLLRRLTAEALRRSLFDYAGARYTAPSIPSQQDRRIDTARFLDSTVEVGEQRKVQSLTTILNRDFIEKLVTEEDRIPQGKPFSRTTPTSAILFGPPGTSKTQLAELIANALGWPLLKLDPSHLTRNGLDRLHAETHHVFTMLAASEQIVVLLDEFDELVLARSETSVESSSRFLTTAMLPRIAALAGRRRIVYLLATNHIERFDDAISRPGRFDLVLPVLPPTLKAKLARWTAVAERLAELGLEGDDLPEDVAGGLADLTFLEFSALAPELAKAKTQTKLEQLVQAAVRKSTMRQKMSTHTEALTWKEELTLPAVVDRIRVNGPS